MSTDISHNTAATNIERLRGHLKDGTLAAKLVDTYRTSADGERVAALKAVAEARLVEIRTALASGKLSNAQD